VVTSTALHRTICDRRDCFVLAQGKSDISNNGAYSYGKHVICRSKYISIMEDDPCINAVTMHYVTCAVLHAILSLSTCLLLILTVTKAIISAGAF
jgi:hypothetical protein